MLYDNNPMDLNVRVPEKSKLTESETPQWKFSDILSDPLINARWQKVRKYFFLRESTYDMTSRCNIRCNGCYYYKGEKSQLVDNKDPLAWKSLMQEEKARGITFVVLAGAEPSLVPDLLKVCYEQIPLGAIATNGIKKIPKDIGYQIHISVWGNNRSTEQVRGAKGLLEKQIANYKGDDRAVFVYTFTPDSIKEAPEVIDVLADKRCRVTFNMFSAPEGYTGNLRHTPDSLMACRETMLQLMDEYPQAVLFSPYSAVAHTHQMGLHELYGCSYPRRNSSSSVGLGRSFRQYRSNLTWDRGSACCVPDTDCADCRHYAAGSAVVTAKLIRHAIDPQTFSAWLDYVDTYLAVWVRGYSKGENLLKTPKEPPIVPAD